MPNSLPFPVRVAAGLLATGIEAIRTLPEQLPGIGVQLIGSVTKTGLRLQQEISELAARGDELLESRTEPQEHPAWARFDDEEGADGQDAPAASGPATTDTPDADPAAADARSEDLPDAAGEPAEPAPEMDPNRAADPAPTSATAPTPDPDPAPNPDPASAPDPAPAGGLPLDGYDAMTIGQVRGHLRRLSRDDVRALLEYEAATADRASFLTLLANRITTLEHEG